MKRNTDSDSTDTFDNVPLGYGLTETSGAVTTVPNNCESPYRSVGQPIPNAEIKVCKTVCFLIKNLREKLPRSD